MSLALVMLEGSSFRESWTLVRSLFVSAYVLSTFFKCLDSRSRSTGTVPNVSRSLLSNSKMSSTFLRFFSCNAGFFVKENSCIPEGQLT